MQITCILLHTFCIASLCVNISYSTPHIHLDWSGLCIELGEVGKFPLALWFQRMLFVLFIENLCGVGSPSNAGKPLRSSFLSLHLLLIALFLLSPPRFTFTTCQSPVMPTRLLCSPAEQQGCVGSWYYGAPPLHSGVTLFYSSTQGIPSSRGIVPDLVGGCTETLQSSAVWRGHAVLLAPKTDRSK